MSKIDRLYAIEILSLTLVILAIVSSVMFVFRLFAHADLIVLSQDAFSTIILFIVFLFPMILKMTIPMSLLIASLIVTLRMSQDREIEAMMASGASVWRIARAPMLIGVIATALSLYSGLFLEPYAREQMSQFRWLQTVNGLENFISSRLEDKTFLTDIFPLEDLDVSLYVNDMTDPSGEFEGVLLSLRDPDSLLQEEVILVAESGSIRKVEQDGSPDYVFSVHKGRIYRPIELSAQNLPMQQSAPLEGRSKSLAVDQKSVESSAVDEENASNSQTRQEFDAESRALPIKDLFDFERSRYTGPLSENIFKMAERAGNWEVFQFQNLNLSIFSLFRQRLSMSGPDDIDIRTLEPAEYLEELRERRNSEEWGINQRYVRDHTYFYEAATVPFACLLLPLIGICLGISDPRRRPGYAYLGLGVSIFLYYAAVMLCQYFALRFWVDPEMTLWFPFVMILCVAGTLLRLRTIYPPSTSFFDMIREDWAKISRARQSVRRSS